MTEVLYFQADDPQACVGTATAEQPIRTPMRELTATLDPHCLRQEHRAAALNLRHVQGTRRDELAGMSARARPVEPPTAEPACTVFGRCEDAGGRGSAGARIGLRMGASQ